MRNTLKTAVKAVWPYTFITVFVLIVYIRNFAFWSSNQTYIFGDTAIYVLNLAAFAKNIGSIFEFKDNFLLWNPNYLSVGIPTLSIVDYGSLYPPNILIAIISRLLGDVMGLFPLHTLLVYLHIIFGSAFIFKTLHEHFNVPKAHAILGSIIWTFAGFNTEFIAASAIMMAGSYLPFCVYTRINYQKTQKARYLLIYFISLAFSFLIGYPMSSLIIAAAVPAYIFLTTPQKSVVMMFQHLTREFIGFMFITLPIISPLYFTAAVNLSYTIRGPLTLESFLQNPAGLSNLVEPLFPKNTPFNTENLTNLVYLYFSLVGAVIFIQSDGKKRLFERENLVLAAVGGVGFLLAIGKLGLLSTILYYTVPGISLFRRLSVFSLLPAFAFAMFVPQLVKDIDPDKGPSKEIIYGIAILLILSLVNLQRSLAPLLTLTSICITMILAKHNKKILVAGLVVSLLIEAGFNINSKFHFNSPTNPAEVFKPSKIVNILQGKALPFERIDFIATPYVYNTSYINLNQTVGYISLASRYGSSINERLYNSEIDSQHLKDLLGIRYTVKKIKGDAKTYFFNYSTSRWEDEPNTSYTVAERPNALPIIFYAKNVEASSQTSGVLDKIITRQDPKTVFLNKANTKDKILDTSGDLKLLEYSRNYIKLKSGTKREAFVANSTAYYPGWLVRTNGKWAAPIQTNWFMMGTYVPKGENLVEFIYIPYGIIGAALYTAIAAVVWLGVVTKFVVDAQRAKHRNSIL